MREQVMSKMITLPSFWRECGASRATAIAECSAQEVSILVAEIWLERVPKTPVRTIQPARRF
jgi:hypothetical protein